MLWNHPYSSQVIPHRSVGFIMIPAAEVNQIDKEDVKMAKGENIFKRKDGRWEARYVKSYDALGKIRYGYCYGRTYREAKEKAGIRKAKLLVERSRAAASSEKRFCTYCDEWLKTRKYSWKESTYIKYYNTLERHIKPRLGNMHPLDITSGVIADFSQALVTEEALSVQSVRNILIQLRSVLKFTANHFKEGFPYIEIVYPKEEKREMAVLTRQEQKCFVKMLLCNMDHCKFGILLALQTGMRIGEVCALRWENIDLASGTIAIAGTMQRLKDPNSDGIRKTRIVITPPKSSSSVRVIPMSDQTLTLCRRMYSDCPSSYVLTGTEQYMEPRTLQYRLKKYTEECGLTGVHFHTLRHSFATRCVEVGFEIKSLSEILGHSSTKITLDRYVHASLELKKSNMEKLDSLNYL